MKTYYGATFMTATDLAKAKIYHPMKIEYYKISQNKEQNCIKYGIQIVKKIYKNKQIETEQEKLLNITPSEEKVEEMLELLKNYQATPINLKDVMEDLTRQI